MPATLVAGSFRNGVFSSIETGCYKPTNWIEKLNQQVANPIDQAYWTREKRKWPVDMMGGHRHQSKSPKLTIDSELRQTIIDTERLLKHPGREVEQNSRGGPKVAPPLTKEHYGYAKDQVRKEVDDWYNAQRW